MRWLSMLKSRIGVYWTPPGTKVVITKTRNFLNFVVERN